MRKEFIVQQAKSTRSLGMARFGSEAELAAFLGKLDQDYARYTKMTLKPVLVMQSHHQSADQSCVNELRLCIHGPVEHDQDSLDKQGPSKKARTDPEIVDREEVAKRAKLQAAVQALHEAGFVHGDLRSNNILVVSGTECIIELEWADIADQAVYPVFMNHTDVV
ncbi:hypothetical protein WJX79_006925 [Trebouxia sp. C0005]